LRSQPLCACSSAAGAAVTLGPADLSTPGSYGFGCQSGLTGVCSFVHLPGAAFTAAAPSDGVITRWRFRAGCCLPAQTVDRTAKLRVFRQTTTTEPYYHSATAVRTGPSFVVPAGGVLGANAIVDVPARVRISAGELVGVDTEYSFDFNGYGGDQLLFLQPAPADGADAYGNTSGAVAMNVDVEPDADGDGYGDETQDCLPTDPAQHPSCGSVNPPSPVIPLPVGGGGPCVGTCGGGGAVFTGVPVAAPPTGNGLSVFIPVQCPTGHTGACGGFLVAALPGASGAAASARAKQIVLGRAKFSVAPGAEKKVRIKFNRAAKRLFKLKRTRKIIITIHPDGGDPISIRRKITFRQRR
jgi:hypothetical protein